MLFAHPLYCPQHAHFFLVICHTIVGLREMVLPERQQILHDRHHFCSYINCWAVLGHLNPAGYLIILIRFQADIADSDPTLAPN
jgi:hypothetical protein